MGVRETRIENTVKDLTLRLGWVQEKMGSCGWPDRIILKPNNRIFFVETKTRKGPIRVTQEFIAGRLRELGYRVYFPRSIEEVVEVFRTERNLDEVT